VSFRLADGLDSAALSRQSAGLMRGALVFVALLLASPAYALTPNIPEDELEPHFVVNIRIGSINFGFGGGSDAWVR